MAMSSPESEPKCMVSNGLIDRSTFQHGAHTNNDVSTIEWDGSISVRVCERCFYLSDK
jgi:hypothetical protein